MFCVAPKREFAHYYLALFNKNLICFITRVPPPPPQKKKKKKKKKKNLIINLRYRPCDKLLFI